MKRIIFSMLALCGFVAAPARGADVTVNFTGRFVAGPCSFSVSDVDLGTHQAPSFTGGTVKGWANITIARTSCQTMGYSAMRFVGTADTDNAEYWRAPGVTGIAIEIARTDLVTRVIPNVTQINWSAGANAWPLRARLVQTRANVTAGQVRAPITIQITYH
ncbi:fimbrial protein [Stenotrophomonas maltophilia]|uniref:fimbrial protein n=1 Tax=Stenotrophomonas maltophilia TaxID=40324 RepID=UPI0039C2A8D8